MQRWKHRPEGSNWGDFGPDDQLGRLNLITEEQVLKGAREIRAGKTFCLSLPLDLPGGNVLNPRRHPPQLSPTRLRDTPYLNFPLRNVNPDALDVLSDDQVLLSMQYSTQWDALAHVGALFDADGDGVPELRYYNGYAAGVDVIGPADGSHAGCGCDSGPSAALKLGIEHLAQKGMQGRGVLVDLERHYGAGRTLIGHAELMRVIEADGIEIEPGDMLVLRTGYAEAVVAMNGQPTPIRCTATAPRWTAPTRRCCSGSPTAASPPSAPTTTRWKPIPRASAAAASHAAAAPPLPVQAGPAAGRAVVPEGPGRLAARQRPSPLHADRAPLRLPHAIGSPVTPIATV